MTALLAGFFGSRKAWVMLGAMVIIAVLYKMGANKEVIDWIGRLATFYIVSQAVADGLAAFGKSASGSQGK